MIFSHFTKTFLHLSIYCFVSLFVFGCSQSSTSEIVDSSPECTTQDDPSNDLNCGELILGITDADGDFTTYTVDIKSILMTHQNGALVSLLSSSQRIDFTEYVDLSELVTVATVPQGTYTSGTITLDYTNADIQVEKDNISSPALMVDDSGNPVTELTLDIQLDHRNQLIINRASPALLELDFNLLASHTVDLSTDPITVNTEPFISAEIEPVVEKEFRLRGPLLRVNQDDSFYRIAVRPFYNKVLRQGGVNVHTIETTEYLINDLPYTGDAGLSELTQLDQATATVALGTFNREEKKFTAQLVLAGSSVPGFDKDAVKGVVVSRSGNQLEVHGATLIRTDGSSRFRGVVSVTVDDETHVIKQRNMDEESDTNDISVGQAVTILGTVINEDIENSTASIDATDGTVKMRITSLSGNVNDIQDGQVTLDLQSINGRSASLFNFSGTGLDNSLDADPNSYQVGTEQLDTNNLSTNTPVRARGFVSAFGTAPNDFNALTIIDYSEVRSELAVGWEEEASDAIANLNSNSIELNLSSEQLGSIHHLKQAGIRLDLAELEQNITIIPNPDLNRGAFGVAQNGNLSMFTNFNEFSDFLQQKLDEGTNVKLVHSIGGYSSSNNQLSAYKIAIVLY